MTSTQEKRPEASGKSPPARVHHPYLVLVLAITLPCSGQVLNNTPGRGLLMLFFIIMMGMVSFYTTTPEHSVLGRFAGGIFIYAISIMDAYRWARYRWEYFKNKY